MAILGKNFSDLVSFTRASGGTSFRPVGRGTLVNQLLYSQWGGGGTAPTGWLAYGSGAAEGVLLPSGMRQRVFTSAASQDFIYQTIALSANTVYTVAVAVDANPGGYVNMALMAVASVPAGATAVTASSGSIASAGSVILITVTTSATAGNMLLRMGTGSQNPTTGSATLSAPALFQGVVTAQQIIDNGGLPITFSAPDNVVRIDNAGDPIQMLLVPANYPRRDYDPVTGVCKGLLVEEQRTNLLLWSNDFTNALWIKSGLGVGSAPVLNPTPVAGPDGTMTATRVTLTNTGTTSSDWSWLLYNMTCTLGISYSFSALIRAATPADVGKEIIWPGVAGFVRVILTADYKLVENAAICGPTQTYSFGPRIRGTEVMATTVTLDICHAQLEVGAFATSRIPTAGAAATRAADVPVVNTLAPWYNTAEGTLYAEISSSAGDGPRSVTLLGASAAEQVAIGRDVTRVRTGSVDVGAFFPTQVLGTKMAVAWANGQQAAARNGVSASTTNAGLPTGIVSMLLGQTSGAAALLNGHIRRIQYIPKRLSDAKLQALTA